MNSQITNEMKNEAKKITNCNDCNLILKEGVKRVVIFEKEKLHKVVCQRCFLDFQFKKFFGENISGLEAQSNAK